MPRPPAASVTQIFEVLKKENIFNKDGNVKKKSDKIWKRASVLLNNVIISSTLYFYVTKNWNGLGDKLKEYWSPNEYCDNDDKLKNEREKIIDKCIEITFFINFNADD